MALPAGSVCKFAALEEASITFLLPRGIPRGAFVSPTSTLGAQLWVAVLRERGTALEFKPPDIPPTSTPSIPKASATALYSASGDFYSVSKLPIALIRLMGTVCLAGMSRPIPTWRE